MGANVQKLRELKNANITHVSYVDKGANKKQFFMMKSDDAPTFQKEVQVLVNKEDSDQLVYGVVYEPDVEDAHGDYMTASEIEKAAHGFVKEYRNMDTQHDFEAGVGEVVESYIAPSDFEVGGQTIAKGSWVLVTRASDDVWQKINKGEITGYSMAGTAEAIEKEAEQYEPELPNMGQFMKAMKNFFTKGEFTDAYNRERKRRNMFTALWMFEDYVIEQIHQETPDVAKIQEYTQELSEILTEVANSPDVLKSLQKEYEESEEISMKKEEMQELMKDALAPLNEKLDTLEKQVNQDTNEGAEDVEKSEETNDTQSTEEGAEGVEKAEEKDNNEELLKQFKQVVTEAVNPIEKRLDKVEKARGLSNDVKDDAKDDVQKNQGGTWDSLFNI